MACCGPAAAQRDYDNWRYPRTLEWKRLVTGDDVPLVLAPSYDRPLLPSTTVEVPNPLHTRSAQQWFNNLPDDTARAIMNTRRSMMREQQIVEAVFSMSPKPPAREPRPTADMVLEHLSAMRAQREALLAARGGCGRRAAPAVVTPRPGTAPPQASGTQKVHTLGVKMRVSQATNPAPYDPLLQPTPGGLPPPLSVIIAKQKEQELRAAADRKKVPQAALQQPGQPGQPENEASEPQGNFAAFRRWISPSKKAPEDQSAAPDGADPQPWYRRVFKLRGASAGGTADAAVGLGAGAAPEAGGGLLGPQSQLAQQPEVQASFQPQFQQQLQPQFSPQAPDGADPRPWYRRVFKHRGASTGGTANAAVGLGAGAAPEAGGRLMGPQSQLAQQPEVQASFQPQFQQQLQTHFSPQAFQPQFQQQLQPQFSPQAFQPQFQQQLQPQVSPQAFRPQPVQPAGGIGMLQPLSQQPQSMAPAAQGQQFQMQTGQQMLAAGGAVQPAGMLQLQQMQPAVAPAVRPAAQLAGPYGGTLAQYPQQPPLSTVLPSPQQSLLNPQPQQTMSYSAQQAMSYAESLDGLSGATFAAASGPSQLGSLPLTAQPPVPPSPYTPPYTPPYMPPPPLQQQQALGTQSGAQVSYSGQPQVAPQPLPPPSPASSGRVLYQESLDGDEHGLEADLARAPLTAPAPLPVPAPAAMPSTVRQPAVRQDDHEYGLGAEVEEASVSPQPPLIPAGLPRNGSLRGQRGSGLVRTPTSYDGQDPYDIPEETLEATAVAVEQRLGFAPPALRPTLPPSFRPQPQPLPTGPRRIQRQQSLDEPAREIEDVEEEYGLGTETSTAAAASRPVGLPPARRLAAADTDAFSFNSKDNNNLEPEVAVTPQRQGQSSFLPAAAGLVPERFGLEEEDP